MNIQNAPRSRYVHTIAWSIVVSALIVGMAAMVGRAANNFNAALTEKPDVALYVLLPERHIGRSELVRETGSGSERVYLAETASGTELITLKKGAEEWYVADIERVRED